MRRYLFFTSALLALGTTTFWALKGAHTGWSQTSVKTEQLDDITGLSFPVYQDKFVPGVDFLLAAFVVAGLLAVVALFFRKKPL